MNDELRFQFELHSQECYQTEDHSPDDSQAPFKTKLESKIFRGCAWTEGQLLKAKKIYQYQIPHLILLRASYCENYLKKFCKKNSISLLKNMTATGKKTVNQKCKSLNQGALQINPKVC